ncbi:hypothetical protein D3C73_1473390 [compost metagenome]
MASLGPIGKDPLQFADLVDFDTGSVRRQNRQIRMVAMLHLTALQALTAGIVLKNRAKYRLGQRQRCLHLPASRRTGEQIGMTQRAASQRILQDLLGSSLSHYICKRHIFLLNPLKR